MQDLSEQEIRISMDEAREVIEMSEQVKKLVENPLFAKVIGKEYFEAESVRLVALMGEDALDENVKMEVQKMMYGIAYFQRWLRGKVAEGQEMEKYLEDANQELNGEVH